MVRPTLICLLLCAFAWGQEVKPVPKAPVKPAAKPFPATKGTAVASISPETPVITFSGICEKKPAAPGAACKTVVTKAQFEQLVEAAQPNMPQTARRQLADRYAMMLVLAHKGHEKGLDKGPAYEEMLELMRMQVLAQQLLSNLKQQSSQISEKEIEDYYHSNEAAYDEATVSRVYVPKTKQIEGDDKLSDADKDKQRQEGEAEMKKAADDLRARAAAGEDFTKLQEEAFKLAGTKANGMNPNLGKVRRTALPPNHVSIMDLKAGEVSQVITDPAAGYFIYKVESKGTVPLEKVREEIRSALENQKMQDALQQIKESVKPEFNEQYFAATPSPMQEGMAMPQSTKPPVKSLSATPK